MVESDHGDMVKWEACYMTCMGPKCSGGRGLVWCGRRGISPIVGRKQKDGLEPGPMHAGMSMALHDAASVMSRIDLILCAACQSEI